MQFQVKRSLLLLAKVCSIIVADMILLVFLLIAKIVNLFLLLHFSFLLSLNEKKEGLVQFFPSFSAILKSNSNLPKLELDFHLIQLWGLSYKFKVNSNHFQKWLRGTYGEEEAKQKTDQWKIIGSKNRVGKTTSSKMACQRASPMIYDFCRRLRQKNQPSSQDQIRWMHSSLQKSSSTTDRAWNH